MLCCVLSFFYLFMFFFFFFFFSSRRRHTRLTCDWSSDVCSSDLSGNFYWYLKKFPEWGSYAPGVLPLLAVSVTYVVIILAGHGLMRLVAGPAGADSLTRSWRTSAPRGV